MPAEEVHRAGTSSQLSATPQDWPLFVAGRALRTGRTRDVRSPYSGSIVGSVALASREFVDEAVNAATVWSAANRLSRHERAEILFRAEASLLKQADQFALGITQETGLALHDTRYEVARACDVLKFSAIQALEDDGQAFAGDVSATGKSRRIFTMREPLRCAAAITPFNHPLNTVAHKLAPAIAAGTPVVLKPSEKTPITAIRLAQVLFEAGLPGPMLSVLLGSSPGEIADPLVRHDDIEALTFTGSTSVGRHIAQTAGYKRLALELGGNSELIVLPDADLDLAVRLACEGAFRNSGQRCTAAKRLLVHRDIEPEFTRRLAALAREYVSGDPMDARTRVGTVIDEAAAINLERMIHAAVEAGARLLVGGARHGARLEPTVLADVPRSAEVVCKEAFGPIAKVMPVKDLNDAIALANSTNYGLSSAVVTNNLESALRVVREVRTGNVNVNEVPGYRTEMAPFGGVKDSGLGVKEGVREAARWFTTTKTISMPW